MCEPGRWTYLIQAEVHKAETQLSGMLQGPTFSCQRGAGRRGKRDEKSLISKGTITGSTVTSHIATLHTHWPPECRHGIDSKGWPTLMLRQGKVDEPTFHLKALSSLGRELIRGAVGAPNACSVVFRWHGGYAAPLGGVL